MQQQVNFNRLPVEYFHASRGLQYVIEEGVRVVDLSPEFGSKPWVQFHSSRLINLALRHLNELYYIIEELQFLVLNPNMNKWESLILIAEILWGTQSMRRKSLPQEIILYYDEEIKNFLEETVEIVSNQETSIRLKRPRYVRINTLMISIQDAVVQFAKEGWVLLPRCESYQEHLKILCCLQPDHYIQDYHISQLFAFPAGTLFYEYFGFLEGKCILQDKGCCMASYLLNPQPGSTILEFGGAPGFKTNHLACLLKNNGRVYSTEIRRDRFYFLKNNVVNTNSQCVQTINIDFLKIRQQNFSNLDYILINPSTSSSGLLEYSRDSKLRQEVKKFQRDKIYLKKILNFALQEFPSVKKVVYTTNSIFPEENEKVIEDVLNEVDGFYSLLDIKDMLKSDWISYSNSDVSSVGSKCLYTRPEVDFTQGHFVAIFQRKTVGAVNNNNNNKSINLNQVSVNSKSADSSLIDLLKAALRKTKH